MVRGLNIETLIEGVKIPRDIDGDFIEKVLQAERIVVL